MLPRETSARQLKRLRELTKGTDIGDITSKTGEFGNIPNLTYIGNPADRHIDTYEEFAEKDNKLQTIAFKSKLVNKPIKEKNNHTIMSDKINNLLNFEDFEKNWKPENASKTKRTDVAKDIIKEKNDKTLNFEDFINENIEEIDELSSDDELKDEIEPILDDDDDNDIDNDDDDIDIDNDIDDDDNVNIDDDDDDNDDEDEDNDIEHIKNFDEFDIEDRIDDIEDRIDNIEDKIDNIASDNIEDEEDENENDDEDENENDNDEDDEDDIEIEDIEIDEKIKSFESFKLKEVSPKKKEQPKYTMLGEEQKLKTDPNFGYASVRDQEIKKIARFNNFVIDPETPKERPILNAGQYVENEYVRGYVNRIEGKDVFVESLDEPMTIKKYNIKDIVKIKRK